MAEFGYRAVDRDGRVINGVMAADSDLLLDAKLKELGYWLIEAHKIAETRRRRRVRVPRRDLIEFCNSMGSMLAAGVTVDDAVKTIAAETTNASFKYVLDSLSVNIQAGASLVAAMSRHPDVFTEQMRNILKAGEYSGNLPEVFTDLTRHLEWVDRLITDVKQASLYPSMVLFAVFSFIVVLVSFVVPRFSAVLKELDLPLPLATRMVMAIGDFGQQYWWVCLLLPFALWITILTLSRRSPAVALAVDHLKLRLPLFGKLNHMLAVSRLAHNLAALLKAGVPILDALALCRDLAGNRVMSNALRHAEGAVAGGVRLSEVFRQHAIFPPILLRMIVVGEETGWMDKALANICTRLDEEIPRRIKRLFGILEPAVIAALIGVVGFIAASIFMPLLSIMSGLH